MNKSCICSYVTCACLHAVLSMHLHAKVWRRSSWLPPNSAFVNIFVNLRHRNVSRYSVTILWYIINSWRRSPFVFYANGTGCITNISVCISKLLRQFLSAYKITNQSHSGKHICFVTFQNWTIISNLIFTRTSITCLIYSKKKKKKIVMRCFLHNIRLELRSESEVLIGKCLKILP